MGIVGLVNAVTIVLMYAGAPIFGPLNDLGVATAAILQAVLAWRLQSILGVRSLSPGIVSASAGAGVAVLGSALVISGLADWFVAGLVTTVGYSFLGIWVVVANRRARLVSAWPADLATFGVLIGAIMCLGFLAVLATSHRVGSPGSAPWFVWAAYLNGVGWFILLPVWNFRIGRYLKAES